MLTPAQERYEATFKKPLNFPDGGKLVVIPYHFESPRLRMLHKEYGNARFYDVAANLGFGVTNFVIQVEAGSSYGEMLTAHETAVDAGYEEGMILDRIANALYHGTFHTDPELAGYLQSRQTEE